MYKFEKKFLSIIAATAVFLILLGILIYSLISEPGTEEKDKEHVVSEENAREERRVILDGLNSSVGESKFSPEEREEILKSLSAPKK